MSVCKRLSARMRREEEAKVRLSIEADILERLDGRGAPKLVARGEDAAGPFVVMERTAWPVLRPRLAAYAEPASIAEVARAAFAALASVHEAADVEGPLAVVHADLSVDNVAIAEDAGGAMVLDFGLAWWRGGAARDGAFRGTLAYAAPEVARGEAPTIRSDLFSLAAALLHVATRTPPRSETGGAALLAAAATEPLPYERAPSIRSGRLAVLLGCVEVDPAKRPASAGEVLAALSRDATRAKART